MISSFALATVAILLQDVPFVHESAPRFSLAVPPSCTPVADPGTALRAWRCPLGTSATSFAVLGITVLRAEISPENFDETLRLLRQQNASAERIQLQWKGISVDGVAMTVNANGQSVQALGVDIPLQGNALSVSIGAPSGTIAELQPLLQSALDGLEGTRAGSLRVLTAEERADAFVRSIAGLGLLALGVLLWRRVRRKPVTGAT